MEGVIVSEREYRELYVKCYRGVPQNSSGIVKADQKFRRELEALHNRPLPKTTPHECKRDIRKVKIKGESVVVEWRH